MQEIAMSILDIVNNSIRAKATLIKILIHDSYQDNCVRIEIIDDGYGMDKETVKKVVDPFFTSRKTRNIGLGVPLFKESVEMTGGLFEIESCLYKGTRICGQFVRNHIDRPPMGDLVETMVTLIQYDSSIDYIFEYSCDDFQFVFNTKEIKEVLDGVPINHNEIILWLKDYIKEGLHL